MSQDMKPTKPGATNADQNTVEGFGQEWDTFNQEGVSEDVQRAIFSQYFHIFPWNQLPENAQGFDLGCGSGRWAALVAPRVGHLHCVDAAAAALAVARKSMQNAGNVSFHLASVDAIPLPAQSQDFGYSLGVLHHVPNTADGIAACVDKLKVGAPFLIYLYYSFDNRPGWFYWVWRVSDVFRTFICRMPYALRLATTNVIAATVYWPASRLAWLAEKCGLNVSNWPLSDYRQRPFYTLRNDALDRFGTRLEQRFSRAQISSMMTQAGLERIQFYDGAPYWVALGWRSAGVPAASHTG